MSIITANRTATVAQKAAAWDALMASTSASTDDALMAAAELLVRLVEAGDSRTRDREWHQLSDAEKIRARRNAARARLVGGETP